jgi:hypothetical protein
MHDALCILSPYSVIGRPSGQALVHNKLQMALYLTLPSLFLPPPHLHHHGPKGPAFNHAQRHPNCSLMQHCAHEEHHHSSCEPGGTPEEEEQAGQAGQNTPECLSVVKHTAQL